MLSQNVNGKVVCIKFSNGEEILTELVNSNHNELTIRNPLIVEIGDTPSDIKLRVYSLAAELNKSIDISRAHLIFCSEVNEVVTKEYFRIIGESS